MTNTKKELTGLNYEEVVRRQQQYGKNELIPQKKNSFLKTVLHTLCEPMFVLLIIAAVIYFILGEPGDGAVLLIFVVGIIIMFYDNKKAIIKAYLDSLKK